MNVAILGSGHVGRALGLGFVKHGHDVVMGTRDPHSESAQAWMAEAGEHSVVDTYETAAKWCDLAVFVPSWSVAESVVGRVGPDNLSGKVLVDVTNPVGRGETGMGLVVSGSDSAGETVQRWFPDAKVVKAWNTIGASLMVDPQLAFGPPLMPIAGDDDAAKATVSDILVDFGFEVLDAGSIDASRYIEPMVMIWMAYGQATGNWANGWKLLSA